MPRKQQRKCQVCWGRGKIEVKDRIKSTDLGYPYYDIEECQECLGTGFQNRGVTELVLGGYE